MKYEEIKKYAKNILSEKRYKHSEAVAKRAVELAKIYGEDEQKAELIGIAHDIAKEMPKEEALKYIKENGIELDEIEELETGLWHSKIGAHICIKKFGFTQEMAQSITYHTTGNINMTTMDKIIYIADKTEETRPLADLKELVDISNKNLDEGMLVIARTAINYSIRKKALIHPDTIYMMNKIIIEKRKLEYN